MSSMEIDRVRMSMHNVKEPSFDGFYNLGPVIVDGPDTFVFDLAIHGKPDIWDRPRAMNTSLFFDSRKDLLDFLSSLKKNVDQLRAKIYKVKPQITEDASL